MSAQSVGHVFKVGAKLPRGNGWTFSYYGRSGPGAVCAARAVRLVAADLAAICQPWEEIRVFGEAYAEVDDTDALLLQVMPCDLDGWGPTANDRWLEERGRALAALVAQGAGVPS